MFRMCELLCWPSIWKMFQLCELLCSPSPCVYIVVTLGWVNLFEAIIMWTMQTYLTNVWKLGVTHAAGIVNVWNGLSFFLPIPFAFFADSLLGNFYTLLFSCFADTIGLGLLTLSTPGFLGPCKEKEPDKCIGRSQKTLFYFALALIAAGLASRAVSQVQFFEEQKGETTSSTNKKEEICDCGVGQKLGCGFMAFVSEYVVTGRDAGQGSLLASLAEAGFLIGIEKNSDVVQMASYAPLFVNVNDRRWNPDAIVFNSAQAYGTPSYWMQHFFKESNAATLLNSTLRADSSASLIASVIIWQNTEDDKHYLRLNVIAFYIMSCQDPSLNLPLSKDLEMTRLCHFGLTYILNGLYEIS